MSDIRRKILFEGRNFVKRQAMCDSKTGMKINVLLRAVRGADAHIFGQWLPEGLDGYFFPADEHDMAGLIAQWTAGEVADRRFWMYMVECTGEAVGLLSLYEQDGALSVGVSVRKQYRRRGIAAAAVFASASLARHMGYTRLVGQNRTDNLASISLCKKCGFTCMGKSVNAKKNEVFFWELVL